MLWFAAAGALALAGGIFFLKDAAMGLMSSQPKIIIMDTGRIIDAASVQFAQTPNADVGMALEKASNLAKQINEESAALSSQGYIVMTRQGVISAPKGIDITEAMALKMGVDLSKSPIKNGGQFGMAR